MDNNVFGIVGEMVRGGKVPTEVVNAHVARLGSNVGLTSGTLQEVSNKHLQELAGQAATQNSTAEFIQKYKEAAGGNCANLAPMMEILHGITANDVTRKYLESKAKESTKHDYHSLKERLLQQASKISFHLSLAYL